MFKNILYSTDARKKVKEGIDKVANAVKVTLGYGGRTVIISDQEFPARTTKDGVTVASHISLKDPMENAGAKLVKEISSKTADDVGDGTTTVCVLMQHIVANGMKFIDSGVNPMRLKKGMDMALEVIVKELNAMAIPVGQNDIELLKQVAAVSANNDKEIGDIIGEVYEKLGPRGVVQIEDSMDETTHMEIVDGFSFICGWASQYFVNKTDNTCILENPYVMIVDGKISTNAQAANILNQVALQGKGQSLVIIADDIDFIPFSLLVKNIEAVKSCFIKYNFTGDTREELIQDLCAVTGATLISEKTGKKIESAMLSDLGRCDKMICAKKETKLIRGTFNKNALDKRIADAKSKIENAKHPSLKARAEQRQAALEGGIAICHVGAHTEVERSEKRDRVEDSIKATKAAMEEGIVPGGGTALIRCVDAIKNLGKSLENQDEKNGVLIVRESLVMPTHQIAENAGSSGDYVIRFMLVHSTGNSGYNAKTDEVEDLLAAGIVDPKKVVRVCIENAISAAAQVLISEALITQDLSTENK